MFAFEKIMQNIKNDESDSGAEIIEFTLTFPIWCLIVFTAIEFGYAFWQMSAFNHAMSQISWDIPTKYAYSAQAAQNPDNQAQLDEIKNMIVSASNGSISADAVTVSSIPGVDHAIILETQSHVTDLAQSAASSDPIVAAKASSDMSLYGFDQKKYEYTQMTIKCHYQYKIQWIADFGQFFIGDSLNYLNGNVSETRSVSKNFYFADTIG